MTIHYHHGDLRRAVLDRALEVVAAGGPTSLSLRAIAADLGVSHTAPRHHFGSTRGLLTAIAVDGFGELGERLSRSRLGGGSFLDSGVAYVEFALDRPAHFQVMFQPTLLDLEDAALAAAMDATFGELRTGVDSLGGSGTSGSRAVSDAAAAVIAGWGLVHGIATLALTGNLDRAGVGDLVAGGDVLGITRRSGSLLYGSPVGGTSP
jgi:AcrR family transcriptional regulator